MEENNKYNLIYKSAGFFLITMKLLDDSRTNLERENIVSKDHAQFRTDKACVISIQNKYTNEFTQSVKSDYDINFVYKKGSIVNVNNFEKDINVVHGKGIHFFLTKECAFFYNIDRNKYNGNIKVWYVSGVLKESSEWNEGKKDGRCESWYDNGNPYRFENFINGLRDGDYEDWHITGHTWEKSEWQGGMRHGMCTIWFSDGRIAERSKFAFGKRIAVYEKNLRN
jgi:antitoxin component YwqK of YwqJK toxin-antitoxin module